MLELTTVIVVVALLVVVVSLAIAPLVVTPLAEALRRLGFNYTVDVGKLSNYRRPCMPAYVHEITVTETAKLSLTASAVIFKSTALEFNLGYKKPVYAADIRILQPSAAAVDNEKLYVYGDNFYVCVEFEDNHVGVLDAKKKLVKSLSIIDFNYGLTRTRIDNHHGYADGAIFRVLAHPTVTMEVRDRLVVSSWVSNCNYKEAVNLYRSHEIAAEEAWRRACVKSELQSMFGLPVAEQVLSKDLLTKDLLTKESSVKQPPATALSQAKDSQTQLIMVGQTPVTVASQSTVTVTNQPQTKLETGQSKSDQPQTKVKQSQIKSVGNQQTKDDSCCIQ